MCVAGRGDASQGAQLFTVYILGLGALTGRLGALTDIFLSPEVSSYRLSLMTPNL